VRNFYFFLDKKSTLSLIDNGGQDERRLRRQEARNHYKLAVARKNNVVIILEEIKLNLQVSTKYLPPFSSTLTRQTWISCPDSVGASAWCISFIDRLAQSLSGRRHPKSFEGQCPFWPTQHFLTYQKNQLANQITKASLKFITVHEWNSAAFYSEQSVTLDLYTIVLLVRMLGVVLDCRDFLVP
jgi:hypothetical protein